MPLKQRLAELVRAAFTGIWIESHKHVDALMEIASLCNEESWTLVTWDVDQGLVNGLATQSAPGTGDPVTAIRSINALARPDSSVLLVLPNFHRLLGSTEVLQAVAHQLQRGKDNRTFVVILSPLVQLPPELQRAFIVLQHDLPDRAQLRAIARGIATEADELPEGEDLERLLDAAAGLTRGEAEGAFSLSIARDGKLSPAAAWELKAQALLQGGLLQLHRGTERFNQLGGMDALKRFCGKALCALSTKARPRGILLLGVPGTGKSAFAKTLGNETSRPTLVVDVGSLMGSLVGETESRTRQALRMIDAMSPCVAFIDEIDKALAGVSASGSGDSGVSARMFGTLLSWLNDHTSDAFVIATCNDVSRLPPEFARAERFDAVFFLDLPGEAQKRQIWEQYRVYYELPQQTPPPSPGWTGAEIRSCCRLAALLDIPLAAAAQQVVPIAATAAESISRLRAWAAGRCLDAATGRLYSTEGSPPPEKGSARRVDRRPSAN
jgi:ATPase family associated with various cellular activities (AAA)